MTRSRLRQNIALLVLPLLLTIFPLLFLHREADREGRRAMSEADEIWFERTDIAARRLKEASHPGFWAGRGLQKVRAELENFLSPDKTTVSSEAATLEKRGWKFWGCIMAETTSPGRARSIIAPGFVTSGRALMTQILMEILNAQTSYGEKLSQEPMCSRLRTLFGLSISAIHFQPRMRGIPFAVLMDGRTGYAVWELLKHGGKITGVVLGFMPTMETGVRSCPAKILEAWNSLNLEPVFFRLPTIGINPKPLSRQSFARDPDSRSLVRRINRTIGVRSGPQPDGDLLGSIRLPLTLLDRPLRFGNWRFRMVALDPVCGYIGMLCQRAQAPPAGPLARLRFFACLSSLILWLAALFLTICRGTVPAPGVKAGLTFWLAGVVAVPVLMGFNAATTILADREKTLIDGLKHDLEETLAGIDRESARLLDAQETTCRELLGRKEFITELRRCQLEQLSTDRVFNDFFQEARSRGLGLRAILLFGFNDYFRYQVSGGWSRKTDQMMVSILKGFWGQKIASETPPVPLSEFPPSVNSKQGSSVLSNGVTNIGSLDMTFDRVEEKALGGTMFSMYHTRLCLEEKTWFIACLSWVQQFAYPDYLTARLTREAARPGSPQLVAITRSPEMSLTLPVSASSDLVDFADQAASGRLIRKDSINSERYLYVAFPCNRMSGYVLAARMPLAGIEREIAVERRALHLLIGAGIVLILLMAWLLSCWLAGPIVRISHGLSRIAGGNLDVRVGEVREDELGLAGASLDAMTRALRERRQLSRFVPPQVLEIASAGDPSLAVSGRKQFVTILSLDIRSFTTLSECHPPEKIFRMLNRHLEAMTEIIQSEGGIIDRFIGDAIVAVFPQAVDGSKSHQARATRAASRMMQAHAELIEKRKACREFQYAIGIGLESGEVVTGVLGDPEVQLDFSVLGEAVARAADLEALSKIGRFSRIIASDRVCNDAGPDFVWRPVRGQVKVYELDIPGFVFPEVNGQPVVEDNNDAPEGGGVFSEGSEQIQKAAVSTNKQEEMAPGSFRKDAVSLSPDCQDKSSSWRARFSPALLAVTALIWLLPYIMIRQGWIDLQRSRNDAGRARVFLRLQDDLRFVQQNLEPAMMASLELRHRMRLAQQRTLRYTHATAGVSSRSHRERIFRQYLPVEVEKMLEPLRQQFPSLFWLHDASQPLPWAGESFNLTDGFPASHTWPDQSFQQKTGISKIVRRGGNVLSEISDEDCVSAGAEWRVALIDRMTGAGGICRYLENKLSHRRLLPDLFNLERSIGNLSRQLFRTTFGGSVRQVYIHPFLASDLRRKGESIERALEHGSLNYQRQGIQWIVDDIRHNLLGMLWLAIDSADLTLERTLPMLCAEMRRRGVGLSITANPGPAHPFVALPGPDGELRVSGTAFAGNLPLLVTISRKLDDSVTSSASTGTWGWIVSFLWFLAGIIAGIRWLFTGRLFAPTLRTRLLAAFLLTSLPFIVCSWLILERASEEAGTRSRIDERDRLLRDLRLADAGRMVLEGFLLNLADDLLRRSKLPENLADNDPAGRSRRSILVKELFDNFVRAGFHIAGLNVLTMDSNERYPPKLKNSQQANATSMNEDVAEKILGYIFRQTSGRIGLQGKNTEQNQSGAASGEDTVIGVEFESFSQEIAMILGGDRLSELTLGEKSIGSWALSSAGKEYSLRHTIWHNSVPVGDLHIQWDSRLSEPRQMAALLETYPDLTPDASLVSPCQKNNLMWIGIPPLSRLVVNGRKAALMHLQHWKSPDLFENAALAANRREPVLAVSGTGMESILVGTVPGQYFSEWVFQGELKLGKKLQALVDELNTGRMLLFCVLISVLFLAHRVARRFLDPAAALVEAANCIRIGNYKARLLLDRTDEFGILAEAFNSMARSAEEGRLLGRFVPATARALASDAELSRAARSGENLEIIVMFAGLAGFKKRLTICQPGPLILWLNRHLETMSRIIRRHGGETNKFIGDKILATFTPANGQPLASVMPAAIEAAREMRKAFPELKDAISETGPGPEPQLGIGLVAGSVLAGILGTESVRLEFTVIGDAVNLASRLSDMASNSAGGDVLVDRDLALAVAMNENDQVHFEKLEAIAVKGKSRAIDIFCLID